MFKQFLEIIIVLTSLEDDKIDNYNNIASTITMRTGEAHFNSQGTSMNCCQILNSINGQFLHQRLQLNSKSNCYTAALKWTALLPHPFIQCMVVSTFVWICTKISPPVTKQGMAVFFPTIMRLLQPP